MCNRGPFPIRVSVILFLVIAFPLAHADLLDRGEPLESQWLCSGLTADDLEAGPALGGIEVDTGLELVRALVDAELHLALLVLMQMPVDGWLQAHAAQPEIMASLGFEPKSGLGYQGMAWVDGLETAADGSLSLQTYEGVLEGLEGLVRRGGGSPLDPDAALLAVASRRIVSSHELELELRAQMEKFDEDNMEPVSSVPFGSVLTIRLERTDAKELPVLSDPALVVSAPLFRVTEVVRSAD